MSVLTQKYLHLVEGCEQTLCKNDGYMTNKDGRCRCVCPEGISGSTCEDTSTRQRYSCGSVVNLTHQRQRMTIQTPNYPRHYSAETACTWLIKVSFTD